MAERTSWKGCFPFTALAVVGIGLLYFSSMGAELLILATPPHFRITLAEPCLEDDHVSDRGVL